MHEDGCEDKLVSAETVPVESAEAAAPAVGVEPAEAAAPAVPVEPAVPAVLLEPAAPAVQALPDRAEEAAVEAPLNRGRCVAKKVSRGRVSKCGVGFNLLQWLDEERPGMYTRHRCTGDRAVTLTLLRSRLRLRLKQQHL